MPMVNLVHYDVIIWGSPNGAMHCAFCTRQNIVVPPSNPMLKGLNCLGVSQDLAVSQTGYITRQGSN